MAVDGEFLIIEKFHPSLLSHVEVPLDEDILQTLVVYVEDELFFVQVVAP